jgi:epoxyqueuosine reductase
MDLKTRIREKALALGFEDAGFTSVEPLDLYTREIESRPHMYQWVNTDSFSTLRGAAPGSKHPWARTMVVLIRNYHKMRFPKSLVGRFGRCYQVDERKIRGVEYQRFRTFLEFLAGEGIQAQYDGEIPARMSAARAGIATYGKNCFAYARKSMANASWLESLPVVLDAKLEPDEPSVELGCPPECEDRCAKACPTGALYEPLKMEPARCIAFLSYYGPKITPRELRRPMGKWVYGCDRCQEACPRNHPLMKQDLPVNEDLEERADDFDLSTLLTMSQAHYEEKVWPQFFYMSRNSLDRWQMNAARALGNGGDPESGGVLATALTESPFENVRALAAWALGQVGGPQAQRALQARRAQETGVVRDEIEQALEANT